MEQFPITLTDLPKGCRPLAKLIGIDRFLELADLFGGEVIYIPNLSRLQMKARNRTIRAQYHGQAEEIEQLSQAYQLSERHIRNIVHKKEERR